MLKDHGKQKPEKKKKRITCKKCGCSFLDNNNTTERINGKIVYTCPECGATIKKGR